MQGGGDLKNRVAAAVARSSLTQGVQPGSPPWSRTEPAQGIQPPREGHKEPQELLQGSRFIPKLSSSDHPASKVLTAGL